MSATKVNLDNKDFFPDLGSDMFDWDDEDNMLDIYSDKVAKDGDLSPTQKKVEAPNTKRRHMEDNIVEMVRWVRIFFKDTYQCD